MFGGKTIAVVIPAHNEELLIREAIDRVPAFVDYVIVVDDASIDQTAMAMGRSAHRPGLFFIFHEKNCGVGGTIVSGYKRALTLGVDIAVVMAGDAQMDPADLPALLAPIVSGQADYVKGDRLSYKNVTRIMPWVRYLGNHALSRITRVTSGYPGIRDSQCGYTAITEGMLNRIDLDALYPRYGFPNDILAHLHAAGARVAQVLVKPIYGLERSELSVSKCLFKISMVLLASWIWRVKKEKGAVSTGEMVVHPTAVEATERRFV